MLGVRKERVKSIFDILEKVFEVLSSGIIKYASTASNFLGGLWIGSNGFIIRKFDRLYLVSDHRQQPQ